jgi:hypothetical protein
MAILLTWVTRVLIGIAAGVGTGCVTFAYFILTGDSSLYDYDRMNRHGPPFGPALLALGVGFVTFAVLLWLQSRKPLVSPSGPK